MHLNEYQQAALRTAIYPNIGENITYPTLGMVGEAGEFANTLKKVYRDDNGKLTMAKRRQLVDELGDVMWYVAAIAQELKIGLDTIAEANLSKLTQRASAGTLTGSGER